VLAQSHQVLLVYLSTQLGHEIARVLSTGVEGKETVEVGEDQGSKGARVLAVEGCQSSEALGGQHQARSVLGELGENALVVGAGHGVELVND
jgi:hypothetical protein